MRISSSELNKLSKYPSLSTTKLWRRQTKSPNLVQCRYRKRLPKQVQAKARRVLILKKKMETKNLKLYVENKRIIKENEKLRQKAALLHLENLALLSQLQTNVPRELGVFVTN